MPPCCLCWVPSARTALPSSRLTRPPAVLLGFRVLGLGRYSTECAPHEATTCGPAPVPATPPHLRTPISSVAHPHRERECVCVCARTRREWGRTGTQSSAGIHLLARGVVARHAFHPKEPPAFVWKRRHLRMRTQRCTHDTRGADPPQPARVRAYVCPGLRDNAHPRERAAAPPAGTAGTGTHCAVPSSPKNPSNLFFRFLCEQLTNNKSAVVCRFFISC